MVTESFEWMIISFATIALIANIFLLVAVNRLRTQISRHHSQMLALNDYVESPRFKKGSVEGQPAMLEQAVHQSTAAAETIHLSISETAFGVIDTIAPNDKTKAQSKKLRELHNGAATGLYSSLKKANRHVGSLTDTLIPRKKTPQKNKKKK